MANNNIKLNVGEGQFVLHVPEMKSLDNLVSVNYTLQNEGEINLLDKPIISIKPVKYENENLTCDYNIHFANSNSEQTQEINLQISVMYRDMVINTSEKNYAVRDEENAFTKTNHFEDKVTFYGDVNFTAPATLSLEAFTNTYVEGEFEFTNTPKITNEPTDEQHATNKKYVDDAIAKISTGGVDTTNFVKKDEVLKTLCDECGWVKDLQDQITINGRDIDKLQATQSNTYITTREITIESSKISQTLMGSFYVYNMEYNISEWDNNEWNLEAVSLKNIHKDARSGEVHEVVKKAITSVVFDENMLYINMLTPKMFDYSTGLVKAELSCSYSRVLTKEKEGE